MNKSLYFATAAMVLGAAAASTAPVGYDGDKGIWLGGKLNITPFVTLGFLNDDNPNSMREYTKNSIKARTPGSGLLDDANGFSYTVGTALLLPANNWSLSGRFFLTGDEYSSSSADSRTDWSESVTVSGQTDGGSTWNVSQIYQNIRYDNDFEISQNDRTQLGVNASADVKLSDKSHLIGGAFFQDYDYDARTCYDYSTYGLKLGFAHKLTEKTDWTLTTVYAEDDKDGYDSNSRSVNVLAGIRSRSTEKLSFNVAAGAEFFKDFEYLLENGLARDPETEAGFSYSLSANWKISRRLSLRLGGYGDYQPSEDISDNSLHASTVNAVLSYRPGDNWKLSAGTSYRREDYNRRVVERTDAGGNPYSSSDSAGKKRIDDEISAFVNVSYDFTRYSSFYVNWSYTDVSSSIAGYDYDRQRLGAGVSLRY